MAWPAINKHYSQELFRMRVNALTWPGWRPRGITLHNTQAPNIQQWVDTAARDAQNNRVPGTTRINNLEHYFRNQRKWTGCPHLFIAPPCGGVGSLIWEANRLDASGVHSPSWNNTHLGIEMVADFSREDDDSGLGLEVRNNTFFATAILCARLGLDPYTDVKLHKEDPRTTHDCPGIDFAEDREEVIASIAALMAGGEHDPQEEGSPQERKGVVNTNDLNVRTGPGVNNRTVTSLWKGAKIDVLDSAPNGSTEWLRIRTPAGYEGNPHGFWVSSKYVNID